VQIYVDKIMGQQMKKKTVKKVRRQRFSGAKSFIGRDEKIPPIPDGTIVRAYNGKRAVFK